MRFLVDLPDADLKKLHRLSQARNVSRAALVREAVRGYLVGTEGLSLSEAYGLWGDRDVDGLKYQEKLRGEWSKRSSTRTS